MTRHRPKSQNKSEKELNEYAIRNASRQLLTAKPKDPIATKSRRSSAGLWSRPFHSDSLGVNPEQIPEATKALRSAGVMADFDSDGRMIVTSNKQYREAAKACGLWTGRDGFGGGQTQDGGRVATGREIEKRKQEFRAAVARGEYDQ